jgi:hypothetical protein
MIFLLPKGIDKIVFGGYSVLKIKFRVAWKDRGIRRVLCRVQYFSCSKEIFAWNASYIDACAAQGCALSIINVLTLCMFAFMAALNAAAPPPIIIRSYLPFLISFVYWYSSSLDKKT